MTKDNHIMMTMGGDFQYEAATEQYTNMDKIIHYVNQMKGTQLNLFYSTPNDYTDAKFAAGTPWSVKTDDFFPYGQSSMNHSCRLFL